MHAYGRVNRRVKLGHADARFEIGRTVPGADRQHAPDAGFDGALNYGVAVGVELLMIQMAVRVRQHLLGKTI